MFPLPQGTSFQGGAGGAAGPSRSDLLGGDARFGGDWIVSTGGGQAGGLSSTQVALIAGALLLAVVLWKKL